MHFGIIYIIITKTVKQFQELLFSTRVFIMSFQGPMGHVSSPAEHK